MISAKRTRSNVFVVLLLLLLPYFVSAQGVSPFSTLPQVPIGTKLEVVVTNNGSKPAEFYPLFKGRTDDEEQIFFNKSTLVKWLKDACIGVDTSEYAFAMMSRLASVLKSDIWINDGMYPYYQNSDNAIAGYKKDHSLIGGLVGTYSMQCLNYTNFGFALMMETGLVNANNFRAVYTPSHSYNEVWHKGQWRIMDLDPQTPMFMTASGLNHQQLDSLGWPAAQTELLPHHYFNVYDGSIATSNQGGLQNYFLMLTNQASPNSLQFTGTYEMDATIILPPGASLSVEYKQQDYLIDTATTSGKALIADMMRLYGLYAVYKLQDDTVAATMAMDSITTIIGGYFNLSTEESHQVIASSRIELINGIWHPTYSRLETPEYTISLPGTQYVIGRDVKAPGKVMGIDLSLGDSILLRDIAGDDTIITTDYHVAFWNDTVNTTIIDKANHYLNSGVIIGDSIILSISYNPNIFSFFYDELELAKLLDADSLQVRYLVNGNELISTATTQPPVANPKVYPNPTTGKMTIANIKLTEIQVMNMAGQTVRTFAGNTRGTQNIDLSGLPKGIYLINLIGKEGQTTTRKVVLR